MTATAEVRVETLPCGCAATDVCHEVSCHDDDLAICGADVSSASWCQDDDNCGAPQCIVCEQLAASEDDTECECPCCVDVPADAGGTR